MQPENIFEIKNLSCSYSQKPEEKVLFIDNLNLQSGKIIFLLGASGSGKSTLLETLGLMNDTIASGTVELVVDQNNKTDFSQLWKNNKEDEINKVRKNFLSFIFQNTNLMENFTAYENICLSQMIKSNAGQDKAIARAKELMNQVGLPQSQVSLNTLSVNLSGGQRQRVSFVRALNTDYKVLLCDEPTGNLDEINAHELLKIVKENLTKDKTAILVSHDINLALKYADQIIVITKNKEQGYGEIVPANNFQRNQWETLDPSALLNFRQAILKFFSAEEKVQPQKVSGSETKSLSKSYRNLFIQKEGKVLFGKSNINLLILISIVFITLLSMGFANGSLQYLDKKLNDTFVNWLTVGIPWAKSGSNTVDDFKEKLNSNRNLFLIDTVTSYKEMSLPIFKNNSNETDFPKGRLLSFDDPITKDLFNDNNRVSGKNNFNDEQDLGIVVTEKLLASLGYKPDASVIYFDDDDRDTSVTPPIKFKVPVPIRAVLKEIPGRNKFLITNFFFGSWLTHDGCVFDFKEQRQHLLFFVNGNKDLCKELRKEIESASKSFMLTEAKPADELADDLYNDNSESESDDNSSSDENADNPAVERTHTLTFDVSIDTCEQLNIPGYEVSFNFNSLPFQYATTENICRQITALPFYVKNKEKFTRILDYNNARSPDLDFNNDYLCINFKKGGLDSIDAFSRYLFKELNTGREKDQNNVIEVDAASVKEKKNFNYISKITLLITSLLIVFAMLAIILFISNLLKTHLSKVKMNLGTYKAFGLSNKESKNIYLMIMLRFISIGVIAAFVLAAVCGSIVAQFLKSYINIEDEINYFLLNDPKTWALLFIILMVTISVSYYNVNKILSKTPGDLIYNR